jgi:hypothetical protein
LEINIMKKSHVAIVTGLVVLAVIALKANVRLVDGINQAKKAW